MDMFSILFEPPENKTNLKKSSFKGEDVVVRAGLVVKLSKSSLLFFDDNAQTEIFIPYSQILHFWFTDKEHRKNSIELTVLDLEPNDEVSIVIPKWLAKKERLI